MIIKDIIYNSKKATLVFDNEKLEVDIDLLFKYSLKKNMDISLSLYANICNETDYLHYYNLAVIALKKSFTVKEMRDYLLKRGANELSVNKIIEELINKKYLDDLSYAFSYLEIKGHKESFLEIENKLINKGISSNIIEIIKGSYSETKAAVYLLDSYLSKKKNTPINKIVNDSKRYLLQKGFSEDIVEKIVYKKTSNIIVDEKTIIEKDFYKIYNRLKDRHEEKELILIIKKKLLAMGYKSNTIYDIIKKINE